MRLSRSSASAALESLADTAPVALEPAVDLVDRPPAPVESAAYAVVAEAVEDAAVRRASHVRVVVRRDADVLTVELADDGAARSERLMHVADRVAALDGRLRVAPGVLRVEIPCA